MFASKAFAIVLAVAACKAVPVWVEDPAWRNNQPPSVAFGFGSGFSSDIGGIRHSSGVGASFQSGNGRAVGSGYGSTGGQTYAQGIGTAQTGPTYAQPRPYYNSFGSGSSSSRNFGAGWSPAYSHSNVQNLAGQARPSLNTAVSSAQSSRGFGYNSAVSTAQRGGNYGSALSAAQSHNDASNYGSAVSFAHNSGGIRASAAEALQQRGGVLQQAGASSINSPGLQIAHAHSINAGGYY